MNRRAPNYSVLVSLLVIASFVYQLPVIHAAKLQPANSALDSGRAPETDTRKTGTQGEVGSTAKVQADPLSPLAPSLTATLSDDIGLGVTKNPGDTITYTATISNGGSSPADDALNVTLSSALDSNTTLVSGSVNAQPIARSDSYTASGNIPISLAAPGVLMNDFDPDNGANTGLTVTEVQGSVANVGVASDSTATGRGGVKGSITLSANGSFTYEPPPGFEGNDTFTYKTSDGTLTDTNTVTITISGMVWFIRNTGGGANLGTFSNPFTSIAAFNTANAATGAVPDPKNGDFISLRSGTYSESDGVNLRNTQKLIGEAVQFNTVFTASTNSSSAYTAFAGATSAAPTISTSAGHGIDLGDSNTVRGLNVGNTPGFFGFNGSVVGSPIINTVNVSGTGGAINVSTSGAFGANVSLGTLESSSSPAANLNLVGVTGTLGIVSGGSGFSGSAASASAININGGSVSFTYPGNVTKINANSLLNVSGGHTAGTLTFQTGTLSATAGDGLQFNNADGTYNFNGTTTLGGGDAGVDILNGSGGTFAFAAAASISNPSGIAFNVSASAPTSVQYQGSITHNSGRVVSVSNGAAAGCGTQSFSGSINGSGASATGIIVNNCNSGTINFSGTTLTLSTQANNALTLTGNAGATINFSGGNQSLTTTNGHGINAAGGGAVNITGNDNTINTTGSGLAVNWAMLAAVHSSGTLRFKTINKTGSGGKGIVVNYHDGSFTVTGDDDNNGTPDSLTAGGTITGTSARGAEFIDVDGGVSLGGMTFINATTVDGTAVADCGNAFQTAGNKNCNAPIYFDTVINATVRTVDVNGSVQTGIIGYDVNGLTMNTVTARNGGDNIAENGGAAFKNLRGTISVSNSSFRDNTRAQFDITTNAGITTGNISFLNNEFTGNRAPNLSAQGLLIVNGGTMGTINIGDGTPSNDNNFHDSFSNGFQYSGNQGATSATININRNAFTNTNSAVVLQVAGVGTASSLDYAIENNTIVAGALTGSGAIITSATQGHILDGLIRSNTIGTSGVANSGAVCNSCNGITVDHDGFGRHDVSIIGNTVQRVKSIGIYYQVADASGNVFITGNLVREPEGNPANGIFVQSGTVAADNGCVALTMGGTVNAGFPSTTANAMNSVQGTWDPGGSQSEIFVWRRFATVMNLPGLSGAADAWIAARNSIPDATGPDVTATATPFGSAASCPLLLELGGISPVTNPGFNSSGFDDMFSSLSEVKLPNLVSKSIATPLQQAQLNAVAAAALERWRGTGLTDEQIASLHAINFEIADLPGFYLGEADGDRLMVDSDAGGHGWFIDSGPLSNASFAHAVSPTRRYTDPASAPAGRVDLQTAIEHEIGHYLGLADSYLEKDRDSIMYGYLTVGERRVPAFGQARHAKHTRKKGTQHLSLRSRSATARPDAKLLRHTDNPLEPLSGETVIVNGGGPGFTMPGGESTTITFQATVNAPPAARSVSTQGQVSGSNFVTVNTNDPETAAPNDATVTNVNTTITWTGITSTDWNTVTNWEIPGPAVSTYAPGVTNPGVNDVVIPNVGNQPNIGTADIGVYSLSVANGRTLTITSPLVLTMGDSPGGNLTLNGIISGGTFRFGTGTHALNNAGGTGSFSSTNLVDVISGSTVTLNNNLQAGALSVLAGGSMNITNRTLSLNGAALTVPGGATFTTTGSTVIFNGTAAQQAAGIAYNNLTINNTIGTFVIGVTLTGNATVNGALALTSSDLDTGAFTLTQPNTTASTGVSDVVGTIARTGGPFALGTPLTFGNPDNRITFTVAGAGTPTTMTVTMAKTPPATYAAAVARNYTITPTGGSGYTATLRLHYRDAELNGNDETSIPNFNLRRGPSWNAVIPSARNAAPVDANWLENNAVTQFSQWTFATLAPTASGGTITGRIVDDNGAPVEGAVVHLSGAQNRKFITDANGVYRFDNVETGGFYNVTPSRVNYSFSPAVISFSQLGETTEAAFGATATGSTVNPLDTPEYFVRQNYIDFLGREPDEAGFNFWSDQILACGENPGDTECVDRKRTHVSAAYFLSIEFQQTGRLVDGLYRASFGRRPSYGEFKPDAAAVAPLLVVNSDGWQTVLENGKTAFVDAFVQRAGFQSVYGSLSNAAYVDALIANTGVNFTSAERNTLVSGLNGGMTRAAVLRAIVEDADFVAAKRNDAFVMMEYFGYLRREPDAEGFDFWLNKLIQFNGNFEQAEMVRSFIVSTEYRQRFPR